MAISIVEGRPGMGKTVYLVIKIIGYLNAGHEVYTNVDVFLKPSDPRFNKLHYIQSLNECLRLRKGKIVLDEVQTLLNARTWDKLDPRFMVFLQQHRKRGLDLLGASQSVKRADVVFRELVQYFYTVQKLFTVKIFGDVYGLFVLREYDADAVEVDKLERQKWRIGWFPQLLIAHPFVFKVYDTTQEIELDDEIGTVEVITRLVTEKKVKSYKTLDRKTLSQGIDEAVKGV